MRDYYSRINSLSDSSACPRSGVYNVRRQQPRVRAIRRRSSFRPYGLLIHYGRYRRSRNFRFVGGQYSRGHPLCTSIVIMKRACARPSLVPSPPTQLSSLAVRITNEAKRAQRKKNWQMSHFLYNLILIDYAGGSLVREPGHILLLFYFNEI